MPRIDRELLGEAGLLDATTAAAIGIPRAANGGRQWKLSRAALPHSLKSVLATCREDGVTLQMERNRTHNSHLACLGSCLGPTVPMPKRRTALPR